MANTTQIEVVDILASKAMMMRAKLNDKTVARYAKAMQGGATFPPILVFEVGDKLILADGYHRYSAYKKLGIEKIEADVRIGTMDDALLAAVRANAHEGLQRSNADKEKSVKALLASEKWREMSDGEIAREANVSRSYVQKLRSVTIRPATVAGQNATKVESRMGKDGVRRPVVRSAPASAPATPYKPPPLPKFTREQLGAPAEGTEHEQDPDSPPGVTRAQAWSAKYGHVHIRPLDERLKAEREKTVISFITALRELIKPAAELLKHDIDPHDFMMALYGIKGNAMMSKFEERMGAIEPLLTRLIALNTMRQRKTG